MVEAQTYHALAKRRPVASALLVGLAAVCVAASAWARWRPFRVVVEGDSMLPALAPGDWLVATGEGRIRSGSIVVVEHPGRPGFELVKRVEHVPGDAAPGGRVLAHDEYWVAGDRADASTDSRTFGPVPRAAVRGVVRFRYGPMSRFAAVDGVRRRSPRR